MHIGLDHEEWLLTQTILDHYARALHEAREKIDDLQRQLAAANERQRMLEGLAYGSSFL
jgi:hypothetical protein